MTSISNSTVQQFIERQRELFNQFRYKLTPEDVLRMFKDGLFSREEMERFMFPGSDPSICFSSKRWLYAVANLANMIGLGTHLTCSDPEQWRIPSFSIGETEEDSGIPLSSSFERQIISVVYEEYPIEEGEWFFVVGCRHDGNQYLDPEFYALVSVNRTVEGYRQGDIQIYTSRTMSNIEDYAMTPEQQVSYCESLNPEMQDEPDYDSEDYMLMRHILLRGYDVYG